MRKVLIVIFVLIVAGLLVWAWPGPLFYERPSEATTTPAVPKMMTVQVFFGNRLNDPGSLYCERVYPTLRTVLETEAPARAALAELLAGPTEGETERGFFTAINDGVEVNFLEINPDNSTAYADFDGELEREVGGACRVTAIRTQLEETLKQFPTVDSVVLSVAGRTEDILQP